MQEVRLTKVFGAGIAVLVAAFALVAAMFAAQPAYAAQSADLAAGAVDVATQVAGPSTATVRIGETITVSGIENKAENPGTCTWTVKSSDESIATATVSGSGAKATVKVTGVADGTATITVTCTNEDGVSGNHALKAKVIGIKSKTTVGKLEYKRTAVGEVALVRTKGNKDIKQKSITVPKTITVADKSGYEAVYKVTSIKGYAINMQSKTTKIVVGSNVKTIGNHAFCNNPKLKTLIIGKNVTKLGQKIVHKNNKSLKTITIKSKKLKKANVKSCFAKNKYLKTVKAPKGYAKKYAKIFTKSNCGKKVTVK